METEDIRSENGSRKRRRRRNVTGEKAEGKGGASGSKAQGRVIEARSRDFVGRYVKKEFKGYGVFLGKVVSDNDDLYRVHYEDGDFEDLEYEEVLELLTEEREFGPELYDRKERLDELVPASSLKKRSRKSVSKVAGSVNGLNRPEVSSVSKLSCDTECVSEENIEEDVVEEPISDGEADSSSDSCEFDEARDSCTENEVPLIPPAELPPSSGNIGVPEEYVPQLFSVYNFLRSFSIQLFLCPFQLDDFVGSLNCVSPNTLLDAVHFSLMRALRRHLEIISSEGVERALKCLRRLDWTLLDSLTWPVYVVEYLLVMGYTKGLEWRGFYDDVLDREYYSISASRKLMVLQILCDDVLESAELRTEIDMRERLEEAMESGGDAIPPENGPLRVHPKYSKTSACKDPEAVDIIAEPDDMNSSHPPSSLGTKVTGFDAKDADIDQDGNSDECQLCGMDGTLLCCDGCPSAYHSRCIGLSKLQLPKGSWFCPECTANKMEPALNIRNGLKGGTILGIDPYEQVYVGSCNHLLVLKSSFGVEPSSRYYNPSDIPKVLEVFNSSMQHTTLYSGICRGILEYWGMPEYTNPSFPGKTEALTTQVDGKEGQLVSVPSTFCSKETDKQMDGIEGENCTSSVVENNVEVRALSSCEHVCEDMTPSLNIGNQVNLTGVHIDDRAMSEQACDDVCQEIVLNTTSLNTENHADPPGLQRDAVNMIQQICPMTVSKSDEHFGTESTITTGSIGILVEPCVPAPQSIVARSNVMESATCASASGNGCDPNKKDATDTHLPTNNGAFSMSCQSIAVRNGTSSYKGTLFTPHSYVNQYLLGDFAASAAANFAVLGSEENQVSGAQASSNHRKALSANAAVQLKAFSLAANRFVWPNSEKKLVDVSRERCGWCLSCKSAFTSRRGCLLNSAASNASKRSMRITGTSRPIKNGEGSLDGIATYIFYMEENLRGLVTGPFLSTSHQKQWRKKVEQSSITCNVLKSLLLQLEENIRLVAFSKGWVKLVDEWLVESSVTQNGASSVGSTSKRPGGRRNKKHVATSEIATDNSDDDARNFIWWRGGKIWKLVFQKGILPRSVVKKAARQGGSRKIAGIHYAEGSEIPKRTRRFAWRAAVEMSKNAAQLALQVRYLDLHVRWSDLIRAEQSIQDSKGPETVTSVFRNACICDKKIEEKRIIYGLNFGSQKHVPSNVMKNCLLSEQNANEKDKFWFSENHIPLYLIKEFEEKNQKVSILSAKDTQILSDLQRRQLKASRKDIFSYLTLKDENLNKCFCASCEQDVVLRDAIICDRCQGFCHKSCAISSTTEMKGNLEIKVACNRCLSTDASANKSIKKPPINQLRVQGQECLKLVFHRGAQQNGTHQPVVSVGNKGSPALMKSSTPVQKSVSRPKRSEASSYGVIWKKKKDSEDAGRDFRLTNLILTRGNTDLEPSRMAICTICCKPYDSSLMYICCEVCKKWYHADAFQLTELQIFDVVGFKCCTGRKKTMPPCPHTDPDSMKPLVISSMQESTGVGVGFETICRQPEVWETNTTISETKWEDMMIEDDDPLLFSLERVEPIMDFISEVKPEPDLTGVSYQVPQKLPVRRHVKCDRDANGSSMKKPPRSESTPLEANNFLGSQDSALPEVDWELPFNSIKGDTNSGEEFNYEEMGYEPQTFFSFTELLASEDDQVNMFDAPMDNSVKWDTPSNYGAIPHQYNSTEQYKMGFAKDNHELAVSAEPVVHMVPCIKCSQTEPPPELSCEICGMWIHSHCSPWVELSGEGDWRCGHCREWQ